MQRAARLVAQALRAAPQRTRSCASDAASAAAAASREGDSRVVAYALGAFGALPFLAGTPSGFKLLQDTAKNSGHELPISMASAARLQLWYGCSIVSFLGAPHWGLAMASGAAGTASAYANIARYAWGVTPSLLVFPVPGLASERAASDVVFSSLALCFVADAAFTAAKLLPRWYFWHLRVPLTLVAGGSLLATSLREQPPPAAPLPPPPAPPPPKRGWW